MKKSHTTNSKQRVKRPRAPSHGEAQKRAPRTTKRRPKIKGPIPLASRKHRVHLAYAAGLSEAPHLGPAASLIEQGRTTNFVVSYDPALGDAGPIVAGYLLQACEYDYSRAASIFQAAPANLPFEISLVCSSGGAWHENPCTNPAIGVGAITTNPPDALFLRNLMLSEVVEVLSATLNNGWKCDFSNGEALSRVIADALAPCTKPCDFRTAPVWLTFRENWVDRTDFTDRNYHSIGCGVLFLNWLQYQLGYSWEQIVAAGASTLELTYESLTGKTDGFTSFKDQVEAKYPPGVPTNVTSDNIFPF